MPKHPYLLIFLLSAAFFAWVHATPGFGDADAYYHLEMARLTAASGPVQAFPWLPLTTLAAHYADQHFLYHAALIPFIGLFGDYAGLKIATVLSAALAVAAFTLLLKAYGLKRPFLWSLLLLFAPGFVSRLLLTKATALALTAFFLFLAALRRRSRLAVFAVAFVYVWLHAGWPILLAAAAVDALVRRSARLLWPTALGLALGLVANPFFPHDLYFYWEQIVQVVVLGRSDPAVVVGSEWYPIDPGALVLGNAAVLLPMAAGAATFMYAVWTKRAVRAGAVLSDGRAKDTAFAYALAFLFFAMTMRQARHQEYFLPIALLAGALVAETAFAAVDLRELFDRVRADLGRLFIPFAAAFGLLAAVYGAYALQLPHREYADVRAWTQFAGVGAWTRAHVPAGEILFHTSWDDFPQLFYRDPSHRYVAGLDALFFYRKDPATYWLWRDISEGRRREGLSDLIGKAFGARYVIVRMGPDPLRASLKKDPSFERVYADIDAEVWRIR